MKLQQMDLQIYLCSKNTSNKVCMVGFFWISKRHAGKMDPETQDPEPMTSRWDLGLWTPTWDLEPHYVQVGHGTWDYFSGTWDPGPKNVQVGPGSATPEVGR